MAKKSKTTKKHRLKYAQPATDSAVVSTPAAASAPASSSMASPRPMSSAVATGRDFSFVAGDLRRLAVLAVSLVAVELVLWYLMGHTGLGQTLYNLINV
jgi:hypothetical protein